MTDTGIESAPAARSESRIVPALALLALPITLSFLPERFRLLPVGVPFLLAVALAGPMIAAGLTPPTSVWPRIERYAAWIVIPSTMAIQIALLVALLKDMASAHPGIGGLELLATSISIWATNVLIFSFIYWMLDRGGPSGRSAGWKGWADLSFPRGDPSDGVPQDWQPTYIDYLSVAFTTATAFSPCDVTPLRPRTKALMMFESVISLVTIVAVAARAINILGS